MATGRKLAEESWDNTGQTQYMMRKNGTHVCCKCVKVRPTCIVLELVVQLLLPGQASTLKSGEISEDRMTCEVDWGRTYLEVVHPDEVGTFGVILHKTSHTSALPRPTTPRFRQSVQHFNDSSGQGLQRGNMSG